MLSAAPAAAQGAAPAVPPAVESEAREAMARLRSPYTPSHTVDMCPSAGALRDTILMAAAGGQSADEIVEEVIARHGEQLRILPKRSGAGLWAWLAPLAVLVGGAGLIVAFLRGRHAAAPGPAGDAAALSEAERAQLASALREWREEEEEEVSP